MMSKDVACNKQASKVKLLKMWLSTLMTALEESLIIFPSCIFKSIWQMTHLQTAIPNCQHTAIGRPLQPCQVLCLSLKML